MKRINLIRTFGAMSVLGITSVALSTSLTSCNKNDVYLTDLKVGDNLSGKTLKFNTKNTNNFTYDSQVMDSDTYIVELGGDSLVPTSRIYVQFVGGPGEENASVFVITLKGAVIYPCLMSSETNTINWALSQLTLVTSINEFKVLGFLKNVGDEPEPTDSLPNIAPFNDTKMV